MRAVAASVSSCSRPWQSKAVTGIVVGAKVTVTAACSTGRDLQGQSLVSHTGGEPRHPGHMHPHASLGDPGIQAHRSSSTCPRAPTAMSFRPSPVRSVPPLSVRPSAHGAPDTCVPVMRWGWEQLSGGGQGRRGQGGRRWGYAWKGWDYNYMGGANGCRGGMRDGAGLKAPGLGLEVRGGAKEKWMVLEEQGEP